MTTVIKNNQMSEDAYDEILSKLFEVHQIAMDAGCFARGEGFDETDNFGKTISDTLLKWGTLKGDLPGAEGSDENERAKNLARIWRESPY